MQATNIYFSKLVKMGDRLREFNFRKLPSHPNGFHVDVTDDRGNRHMFTLSKIEEHWHSNATDIPSWLQQAETDLGNIIEKELSA
jgi:hypothetical protein